jgi:hypothetical protein
MARLRPLTNAIHTHELPMMPRGMRMAMRPQVARAEKDTTTKTLRKTYAARRTIISVGAMVPPGSI